MLSNLRIIIVLEGFALGGAERQASILAKGLKERGCLVEVWAFEEGGATVEILERQGTPWRCVRHPLRGFASMEEGLGEFGAELRRARPDVLLPYTLVPNIACALVWRSAGARLCVWNQRDDGKIRQDPQLEARAVAQTPLFVSNSVVGADFLADGLGVSRDSIRVIRNGVEIFAPDMDGAAVRERLKITDDRLVGCMIANLQGDKDHVTLVKAWWLVVDELKGEASPPLLLLAGRNNHTLDSLQEFTQRLGLEASVRFLGPIRSIPNLLTAVDVGVFSSRTEGCPNGVLEAMAAGKAVAATDIPGIREALGLDYPYLAAPGDHEGLAEAILALFTRPESRDGLGRINRRRIETEFTVPRMCEETASLIAEHLRA